ncbi:MAG: flavodoxin family protein [Phycisphaerae bacterium]|nr:flavodoxin family protein [Phycisphaerae bacterium]
MAVKVLGISTSPRREGNSDLLLRKALGGAQQAGAATEHLRLCDYRIEGCHECYDCSQTGDCSTRDDYQAILDKMLDADRLVFATPVFFMTVSAQAKLLIDRGQCLWVRQTVLRRPLFEPKHDRRGVLIAVGGSRSQRQFDCVRQPIQGFFKYLEVEYAGSLCVNQVDEKGAILKRPDALDEAFRLGRMLASTEMGLPQRPLKIELF